MDRDGRPFDLPAPDGLDTPCLVVDLDRLEANLAGMAALLAGRGVALRPHAKTHKSDRIARVQLAAGAIGLTVATVSEAEAFVSAGCHDIFVAYPLWVDPNKGARLREVCLSAQVAVGVDSADGVRALAAQVPGISVLVEVDSGQHRTGASPDHAGEVAVAAARAGLDVRGVFTFPGHSYSPGRTGEAARQEAVALTAAVTSLVRHRIEPQVVSGGSTPSAKDVDSTVLNEMRPGVYALGDAQQWELGTMAPEDIALTCVATVVSASAGRVVLDAGSKALGADRPTWTTGHGRLLDHPSARVTLLSEHHAVVTWDGSAPPALGSRVRVVPNHVCTAVNLAEELVLGAGGVWPVTARGANT
jgi:D-serine deaminase-like pyridoxal phosphate-dependent protein